MRLRDELGAELLLSRFDDVKQDEAAALEARLGPLVHALVVPDPLAAAAALLDKPRTLETVWLVRAGAELEPGLLQAGSEDVVVAEHFGARITRVPAQPSVGAGARGARAEQLRARAEALGAELEQLARSGRQVASLRRDLDAVAARAELWAAGDPVPLMAASVRACEAAEEAEREAERLLEGSRARFLERSAKSWPRSSRSAPMQRCSSARSLRTPGCARGSAHRPSGAPARARAAHG